MYPRICFFYLEDKAVSDNDKLEKKFNNIVLLTKKSIKRLKITMQYVFIALMEGAQHKALPAECQNLVHAAVTLDDLFHSPFSNYLAYEMLEMMINRLSLRYTYSFKNLKAKLELYKKDLVKFRKSTTLVIYCRVCSKMNSPQHNIPKHLLKKITTYKWSETITLEEVEQFRTRHARTYTLDQCALMVNFINN